MNRSLLVCDMLYKSIVARVLFFVLWMGFFFQAEDGIRDVERSRGLGDVYKRQDYRGISTGSGME